MKAVGVRSGAGLGLLLGGLAALLMLGSVAWWLWCEAPAPARSRRSPGPLARDRVQQGVSPRMPDGRPSIR